MPPVANAGLAGPDWPGVAGAAVIIAAALAVYGRTFSVPLVYDDIPGILENSTIRHWGSSLLPPENTTAGGRPVLNLSLAANYAVSGTAVWSYHALNLAIHTLAGLVLFGIIRRTLAPRARSAATAIALSATLLWALHPLQTESVTYVIQRAESLMGLFYLLTLYCFIRGAGTGGGRGFLWLALCAVSCLLGMGTKEVMVSAPLVVLLYDRTFVAGSFREAWVRHWRLYGALAATWLALAFLVIATHGRSGSAGAGSGVAWWRYALTQFPAIAHYLRLCLWPSPLVLDYGTTLAPLSARIIPSVLVVVGLAAATLWALVRKPAAGFLGACFFAILAPSSSFVPVATEPVAEHRMYLALAPVAMLAALGIHRGLKRAALPVCVVLSAGLALLSVRRNADYSSLTAIWADTVAKRPGNERAHIGLGNAWLGIPGHLKDAIGEFEEAVRLKPDDAEAHNDLGNVWLRIPGGAGNAAAQYQEALRLKPDYPDARVNLGSVWLGMPGRLNDAMAQFKEALRLRPDFAEAHYDMGNAWLRFPGRLGDAIAEYQEALRLNPDIAEAHYNLATVWSAMPGRLNDAIGQFKEALRLRPDYADAHYYLAVALLRIPGCGEEARAHLEAVLRAQPGNDRARALLGRMPSAPH
jgi:tetratricopeptide (TPR) repeat protein